MNITKKKISCLLNVVTKMVILNLMPGIKYFGYEYLRSGKASLPFNYLAIRSSYDLELSPDVILYSCM